MSRVEFNDELEYEIFEDGYDIFRLHSEYPWITQHGPHGKLFKPDGTYEENAILHCEDLTKPPIHEITDIDKLRADMDFFALLEGVVLPSYEEE